MGVDILVYPWTEELQKELELKRKILELCREYSNDPDILKLTVITEEMEDAAQEWLDDWFNKAAEVDKSAWPPVVRELAGARWSNIQFDAPWLRGGWKTKMGEWPRFEVEQTIWSPAEIGKHILPTLKCFHQSANGADHDYVGQILEFFEALVEHNLMLMSA